MSLLIAVNNSVILSTIARLSKNKKLIIVHITTCVDKTNSTPSNNTALWHYLGTKHLDFRCENIATSGEIIKEIRYTLLGSSVD